MLPIRLLLQATLAGIVLAASIVALKHTQDAPLSMVALSSDQSHYAEIATTSDAGSTAVTSTASVNIPVLVYHIVRPAYPDDSSAVRKLALTPDVFDAEMQYLAQTGYHVISFADLESYFLRNSPLPEKPVVISFDDGWKDQFTYAFPLLVKNHYTAAFFIFTNSIGRKGFVSWRDLEMMRDGGMTIGSHSKSHPYLTRAATSSLESEIVDSKRILEQHLGIQVNEFAYPFGQYNPAIVSLVQSAGYHSARGDFESGKQEAAHLYELSALNAPTTLDAFQKKFLSTGYRGR